MNGRLLRAFQILGLILALGANWASAPIFAEEMDGKNTIPDISNIGFMKNPPKALKEKFPMCDAFLKVEWIDKEKKIGYSSYDLYRAGKKDGQMTALIYLNQYYPHLDYDVYEYRQKEMLRKLFKFIKEGKIGTEDELLTISNGSKSITFWPTTPLLPVRGTLSDNYENVCVPYPDNQRMWIAEGRQVGKIYSDQEIDTKYDKVRTFSTGLSLGRFKTAIVVDINFDGIEDYLFRGFPIFSWGNKYFVMTRIKTGYKYSEWNVPPNNKNCEIIKEGMHYLTTDGKNYFLSNQCNLTELTKGEK